MHTVGSLVFPGSPLAPDKDQLSRIAGFWPDIEKSRAEARRLLKEGRRRRPHLRVGEPQRRSAVQISRDLADRSMEQDRPARHSECGADRSLVRGRLRSGDFSVATGGSCHGIVNPAMDVQPWLPRSVSESNYGYYEDPKELDIYQKMLHETDPAKQRASNSNAPVQRAACWTRRRIISTHFGGIG